MVFVIQSNIVFYLHLGFYFLIRLHLFITVNFLGRISKCKLTALQFIAETLTCVVLLVANMIGVLNLYYLFIASTTCKHQQVRFTSYHCHCFLCKDIKMNKFNCPPFACVFCFHFLYIFLIYVGDAFDNYDCYFRESILENHFSSQLYRSFIGFCCYFYKYVSVVLLSFIFISIAFRSAIKPS